jgi:DNA helicase-2/ATP-dependent DNA helicase PcrA
VLFRSAGDRFTNDLMWRAVETVINAPDRGIGQEVIKQLRELASTESVVKVLKSLNGTGGQHFGQIVRGRLKQFADLISKLHNQVYVVNCRASTDTILQAIIDMTKLNEMETPDDKQSEPDGLEEINNAVTEYLDSRVETLELLKDEAKRFHRQLMQMNTQTDLNSAHCLEKFVNEITLENKGEASRNAVTLSTIHQMKGLETPIGFLMRFNEGFLPVNETVATDVAVEGFEGQSLEEERRIAYVAMTRAKDRLYLSFCRMCRGRHVEPSQFLSDIDERVFGKSEEPVKEVSKMADFLGDDDFGDDSDSDSVVEIGAS